METVIVNGAKYVIIIAGVLFTILSIYSTVKMERYKGNAVLHGQMLLIAVIQLCALGVVAVRSGSVEQIVFCMMQMLYVLMYRILFRAVYKKCFSPLLTSMLFCISISMICMTRLNFDKAVKQFIIICIASIVTLAVPALTVKLTHVKVLAGTFGVVGLILLIAVPLIGSTEYGANLSLRLGSFSLQPSEFVKITFVLLIAVLLRKRDDFGRVFFATCIAAAHVLVLVVSTDLGGALIFFLAYLCMLQVATRKPVYLICGIVAGCAAGVTAYMLFSHVRVRVSAWQDPWSAIDTTGYQIAQSLFAIGSGGWFGTGLYEGSSNTIPVVIKDYIFSAIAEEFGGIFALCLIVVCFCCFCQFLLIASRFSVKYFRLIGTGLAGIYGIQTCLAIGGVIKFIPATGVTLPLVSYGGSSVSSTFLLFCLMQGLYLMYQNEEERHALEEERRRAAAALKKAEQEAALRQQAAAVQQQEAVSRQREARIQEQKAAMQQHIQAIQYQEYFQNKQSSGQKGREPDRH